MCRSIKVLRVPGQATTSAQVHAAALQFVLGHPAVKSVIPGASGPGQVRANLRLLEAVIPSSLWSDLKTEGLLRPDAPVPVASPWV